MTTSRIASASARSTAPGSEEASTSEAPGKRERSPSVEVPEQLARRQRRSTADSLQPRGVSQSWPTPRAIGSQNLEEAQARADSLLFEPAEIEILKEVLAGSAKRLPELQAGDLILEHDVDHVVLWAGNDEKPLMHSAEGNINAVAQTRVDSYLAEEWEDATAAELPVFRFEGDPAIPKLAVEIARGWATRSRDETNGTPFGRANPADEPDELDQVKSAVAHWDKAAAYRVARAFLRHEEGKPLSRNRGVSCSQFATYVYQVAFMKAAFGRNDRRTGALRQLLDRVKTQTLDKSDKSVRASQLETLVSDQESMDLRNLMQAPMSVSTKHMNSEVFHDRLSEPDSKFRKIGYAVPYRTSNSSGARLIPRGDSRARNVPLPELQKKLGQIESED